MSLKDFSNAGKKTLAFEFRLAVASGPVQGLKILLRSFDGETWQNFWCMVVKLVG
jgi:hypothetical protein